MTLQGPETVRHLEGTDIRGDGWMLQLNGD